MTRGTGEGARESVVDIVCAGERLVGILHHGASGARTGVLVVVGGGQYRVGAHRQFVRLARALAVEGVPVLRFDVRGMGDSEGAARHFLALEQDLRAAVDALCAGVDALDGVVLWGLCDGASASILYAVDDPRVRGVVLVNPWISTETGVARAYLRHYYAARLRDPSFWHALWRGRVDVPRSLRSVADLFARLGGRSTGGPAGEPGGEMIDAETEPSLPDVVFGALAGYEGGVLLVVSEEDLTAREFEDELRRYRRDGRLGREPFPEIVSVAADHTFSSAEAHATLCATTLRWLRAQDPT